MPSASGVSSTVHSALGHGNDRFATCRDLVSDGENFFHQFVDRENAADKTGPFSLGRIHHPTGEAEVHGLGLADRRVRRWVPPGLGMSTKRDFRLSELCGVGCDDDVAHHSKFAAAAERSR